MSHKKRKLKKLKKLSAHDWYSREYRFLCITHADYMKFAEAYAEYLAFVPKDVDHAQYTSLGMNTKMYYDTAPMATTVYAKADIEPNLLQRITDAHVNRSRVTLEGSDFIVLSMSVSTSALMYHEKTLEVTIELKKCDTMKEGK